MACAVCGVTWPSPPKKKEKKNLSARNTPCRREGRGYATRLRVDLYSVLSYRENIYIFIYFSLNIFRLPWTITYLSIILHHLRVTLKVQDSYDVTHLTQFLFKLYEIEEKAYIHIRKYIYPES